MSKANQEVELVRSEVSFKRHENTRSKFKFTEMDHYFFKEGTHFKLYEKLGAKVIREGRHVLGTYFGLYAPNAKAVTIVGDFNNWQPTGYEMASDHGIWTLFVPKLEPGQTYKYEITTAWGEKLLKADPYGYFSELRPNTASVVYELDGFEWGDAAWLQKRRQSPVFEQPLNIYELHLGSWKRTEAHQEAETFYQYSEIGDEIIQYVLDHSYTHIELMPLVEHPFDLSWGYQATGYFAASSRYGEPKDLMDFINKCHQVGIGVLMDWVPGHFCKDAHGLFKFDGSAVYEYPFEEVSVSEWGTANFDLGRNEVHSFLISNAMFWMKNYHIDGFRVDAVANMIYWDGNKERGVNQNAVNFIKKLNQAVFGVDDSFLMIAEDSTSFPMVTAPVDMGGLGFSYKWNMGWMNDTLRYMKTEPDQRQNFHHLMTFAMMYSYTENFVLPFSHDEVVHGKKSLVDKAPGDYWQKMAQFRTLLTYQMTLPGKKLNFMANELAQFHEWKDKEQVDWHLKTFPAHDAANRFVKDLNALYLNEPALWQQDHSPLGFEWLDVNNNEQSILSYVRRGKVEDEILIVVMNFKWEAYHDYAIGVPKLGEYVEVLNSDMEYYHGSGQYQGSALKAMPGDTHGRSYYIKMTIPPFGSSILKFKAAATECGQ